MIFPKNLVEIFENRIAGLKYPVLVMLYGKHEDYPYLATDRQSLIESFNKIFETNRDLGYYGEPEHDFNSMSKLELAAFVNTRSNYGCEYETVEIFNFYN